MTNAPLLPSPLLRQALLADAVTTAACAALMIAGAGFLEGLLGLPATLLRAPASCSSRSWPMSRCWASASGSPAARCGR
jgi:hypothetical protein